MHNNSFLSEYNVLSTIQKFMRHKRWKKKNTSSTRIEPTPICAYRKSPIELNINFCFYSLCDRENINSFTGKCSVLKINRKTTTIPNAHHFFPFFSFLHRFVYIFIHIYCFMNKCSLIFVWKRHKPFQASYFFFGFLCVLFASFWMM